MGQGMKESRCVLARIGGPTRSKSLRRGFWQVPMRYRVHFYAWVNDEVADPFVFPHDGECGMGNGVPTESDPQSAPP